MRAAEHLPAARNSKNLNRSRLAKLILSATTLMVLIQSPSSAQSLTYGVLVGTALTNDFGHRDTFLVNPYTGNINTFSETSASRGHVMGGAVLEWHFSGHLSAEADGIYRSLHFNETQNGRRDTVLTWEIPVLAKYSFWEAEPVRPFLEGGPSFRASGNKNGATPSTLGVSIGAGADIRCGPLNLSPALRYTRWRSDDNFTQPTKSDQLELVIDITHTSKLH